MSLPPEAAGMMAAQEQNPTSVVSGGPQGEPIDPTNLPDWIWQPILALIRELELEDDVPRRMEIRGIIERRLFYRGAQNWWYDWDTWNWRSPADVTLLDEQEEEKPTFDYCTNIYQPTVLSLSAVLSQNNTAARFWPEKPSNPQDLQTAKEASKAVDHIHRNNDWQSKVDEVTYFMNTDGFIGANVRYEKSGERFGCTPKDFYVPQTQSVDPGMVECPSCGNAQPGTIEDTPVCPGCGEAMQAVPPQEVTQMTYGGTNQVENGQEIVEIVPALNLRRSTVADTQAELMYLDWVTDLDKAAAMERWSDKADMISSAASDTDIGAQGSYEKAARRLLYTGLGRLTTITYNNVGTLHRVWLRPRSFYRIADKNLRAQLLQLFPKGMKIVFFNDVYCESAAECMDEYWATMHTMQGEGQIRETLTSAIIPINRQFNDCLNLLFEILMYGVPEGFADSSILDQEARNSQAALPGKITPLKAMEGQDIRSKMMFVPAVEPSVAMMRYIDMLYTSILQFISGNYPALAGGDTGANDTASGIAIQRNQALGRIGRAWRRMQEFLCSVDAKAVKCMAKHRQEDIEIPQEGDSGEYQTDVIKIQDLQGNIKAFPEVDAQYPTLQADIRSLILSLWNSGNPLFLATAQQAENLEAIFRYMGCTDLMVPGQQQRKKTYGDIERLLQSSPQMVHGQDGNLIALPTIAPEPDVDNLQVAGETAKSWLISDAGIQAQQQNEDGWQNVKAFSKACTQMAKMQQLQQAIAAQGLAGQGPAADLGAAESMQPPPHVAPKDESASPALKGASSEGEASGK